MISSSKIVANALGLQPDGVPAKQEGECAYCGGHIELNDLHVHFSAGGAFMDARSLAAPGSKMTCGYCAQVLSAKGLMASGHGIFSADHGFIPFRKWKDIAAALENPPTGVFVAVRATANNQHMAWRAPVNLSRELFYVRVGLRDLKIRRRILLEAVEVSVRLGVAAGVKPTKASLPNPFAMLDSDLKDASHGQFRTSIIEMSDENPGKYTNDLTFLSKLTLGETWGLRFLLSPNAGEAA